MGLFSRKEKSEKTTVLGAFKHNADKLTGPEELRTYIRRAKVRPEEAFVQKYQGPFIVVPTPDAFGDGTTLEPDSTSHSRLTFFRSQIPKNSLVYAITEPEGNAPYKVYKIGRFYDLNDIWVPDNQVSRATHAQIITRRKRTGKEGGKSGLEVQLLDANPMSTQLKTFVWNEKFRTLEEVSKTVPFELTGKEAIALCDKPLVAIYFFESAELYRMLTNDCKY